MGMYTEFHYNVELKAELEALVETSCQPLYSQHGQLTAMGIASDAKKRIAALRARLNKEIP